MIPFLITAAALAAAISSVANAPSPPRETVIAFAGGGGIRQLEPGPAGSGIIYLRDRTLRWYKVTLSGPCLPDRTLDTVSFTTDANGTFDAFRKSGRNASRAVSAALPASSAARRRRA